MPAARRPLLPNPKPRTRHARRNHRCVVLIGEYAQSSSRFDANDITLMRETIRNRRNHLLASNADLGELGQNLHIGYF